jgi:hypothetical protein
VVGACTSCRSSGIAIQYIHYYLIRLGEAEPDRETWKKAYELFTHAFREPVTEPDRKRLARILRKPTREEVVDEMFGYEAFLRGLGRMSLSELPTALGD